MSKRKNTEIDLEEYAGDFATNIISEAFSLINQERKTHGEEFATNVILTILASTICTVVYDQLYNDRKMKVSPELATERYAELKDAIQNAVSTGFSGAMTAFSGRDTDYYCQVSIVPASLNIRPC
jgi:hypothetical protein